MKQNNLLASVALFSELYNSNTYKGIPEILAEFIKSAIICEKKFSFDSYQLKLMLKNVYGFEIPESVLRTVVKNRLKDSVKLENKIFHIDKSISSEFNGFDKEVKEINERNDKIFNDLTNYISIKIGKEITVIEKEEVFKTLVNYLMGNNHSNKYTEWIIGFMVNNEDDNIFKQQLNQIKEGVILYQGINYSTNISQLGNWSQPLTIYLGTEHLFNCLGYNGKLFEEIFDDLYKLIAEINGSSKKGDLIKLRYFEETKNEITEFFENAVAIKKGLKRLNPLKPAMKKITDDCKSPSDVKVHLTKFYKTLSDKGITLRNFSFDIENSDFNVVDMNLVEELKKISEEKDKPFNEKYCVDALRIFTRVNTFRKGQNKLPFENIRHIYITENGFTKYLAHNAKVKFVEYDVAFAKDIDFIISKFWFKLKKGFKDVDSLPKSFDFINKAKIVLSSHLTSTLSVNFEKLQADLKAGKINAEEAVILNENLKDNPAYPENISKDNIDKTLDILFEEDFQEDILREQSKKDELLQQTIAEKEVLKKELEEIKVKERKKLNAKKEKELLLEIDKTVKKEITSIINQNTKKRNYFLTVTSLTIAPLIIGVLLKVIPTTDILINSIGNLKYAVFGFLILVSLFEILGRSYIFDKVMVKEGWIFLKKEISGQKRNYINNLINELTEEKKATNKELS